MEQSFSLNTAILVFSRRAREEAMAKKISSQSNRANLQITESLIKQTLATVRKTGLPFFISNGEEFAGSGFGYKLTAAAASIFAKGFTRLIIIGNDCPVLTPAALLSAQAALKDNSLVLGPATDGGVYLIGLTKQAFIPQLFNQLPWQNSELVAGFNRYAQDLAIRTLLLATLADVDNAADLQKVMRQLPPNFFLLNRWQSILATPSEWIKKVSNPLLALTLSINLPQRAPPSCYLLSL